MNNSKSVLTSYAANCHLASCIGATNLLIDSSGETTAFWAELIARVSRRILAMNLSASGAPMSSAVVEPSFDYLGNRFLVRTVGARKFAVFHQFTNTVYPVYPPTHARIVQLSTSGSGVVEAQLTLPKYFESSELPHIVQDSVGQLFGLMPGIAASPPPTPATLDLGGGIALTGYALGSTPYAVVGGVIEADFADSGKTEPVGYITGNGSLSGQTGVFASQVRLTTGALESSIRLAPTATLNAGIADCRGIPNFQALGLGGVLAVGWRQAKATNDGCDLLVDGVALNAANKRVTAWTYAGSGSELVAAWAEEDATPGSSRIMWSRRRTSGGSWSTPAPIVTNASLADSGQTILLASRSSDATIAIVWSSSAFSASTSPALLSKFHAGVWSTFSGGTLEGPRSVAVNANGQAVALFSGSQCQSGPCEELYMIRF